MYQAKFSGHASFRILFGDETGQRTVLGRDEVRTILSDPCRHVLLGRQNAISYILFYSTKDQKHLVVVQDESKQGKGQVITIKLLDQYHGPFPVTDETLKKSKMIAQLREKYIVI